MKYVLLGILMITAFAYSNLADAYIYDSDTTQQLGSTLLVIMALIIIASSSFSIAKFKKLDPLSPWVAFPILYFLIYGIGSIRWVLFGSENIIDLLVYSNIGIISYYLGTTVFVRSIVHTNNKYKSINAKRQSLAAIFLLIFGALGAATFFFRSGGIPVLSKDLFGGRMLAMELGSHNILYVARLTTVSFAFYFSFYSYVKNYYPHNMTQRKVILSTIFISALLMMLSTGNRSDIFFLGFIGIAIHYNSVERTRTLGVMLIALIMLMGIFSLGFYRVYSSDITQLDYLATVTSEAWNSTDILSLWLMYVLFQLSVYTSNFLLILSSFGEGGRDYLMGQVFFVTLWTALPGKQLPLGEILKTDLGLSFLGGGVNPTMLGELYLEFGAVYLVLMMFAYGVILSCLYRRLLNYRFPANNLLYSYVLYALVLSVTGGLFSQLSRWYYLGVILVVLYLLYPKHVKKLFSPGSSAPANRN